MKTSVKIFSATYGLVWLVLAGFLFFNNLFIIEQRLLILGAFLILGIILLLGMEKTRGGFSGALGFFLVLMIFLQSFLSYSVYKTYNTFNKINKPKEDTEQAEEISSIKESLKNEGIQIREDAIISTAVDPILQEQGESFQVYISGIDQYGSIAGISRSDVNIILSVNPTTGRILMTNIPRDSYVKIAGGGNDQYDKLTHAGIYGIASSVKTLENLFGIPINYYVRVNFTSLIEIVNVLGGIEVDNPNAFTSQGGKNYFPAGQVYMKGDEALSFVRERYSLSGGDFERGRNQQRVIAAMIKKAISPSLLVNYPQIMNVVSYTTETNMPTDMMTKLINTQLSDGTKWTFEMTDIKGTGSTGALTSYAMPGAALYMYQLDKDSVRQTADLMKSTLEAK